MDQTSSINNDYEVRPPSKTQPKSQSDGDYEVRAPADFTSNEKGEGLYRMLPSSSDQSSSLQSGEIRVPYSKVKDAQAAGLKLHPDEAPRFEKDSTHEGQGPTWTEQADSWIRKKLEPVPNENKPGELKPGLNNTDRAFGRAIYAAPGFLKDFANAAFNPSVVQGSQGRALMDLIDPSTVPENLQKQFSADMKVDPKMAVDNLIGSIGGQIAVGVATHGLGEKVKSTIGEKAPGPVRRAVQIMTGTTPNEIRKMAEEARASNLAAEQKAREAYEKATGHHAEQTHEKVRKLLKDHEDHVETVAEANARKLAKHRKELAETLEHNAAIHRQLQERKETDDALDSTWREYKAKDAEARGRVKAQNDANWNAWREKAGNEKVDLTEVGETIENVGKSTPEMNEILKSLEVDPEAADVSPQVEQMREENAQRIFRKSYEELNEIQRVGVDRHIGEIAHANGIPLTSDNLEHATLQQVHEWKQAIGYKLFDKTLEPTLKHSLNQVYKALQKAEAEGSVAAGAFEELNNAKESHKKFEKAFGFDRPKPKTVQMNRAADINPEAVRDERQEARIASLEDLDEELGPEVAALARRVKELREKSKSLPKESTLRSNIKTLPQHPYVGDLRDKYNLQTPQQDPQSATGVLRDPNALAIDNKPEMETPEKKTISPEDVVSRKAENVRKSSEKQRSRGVDMVPTAIFSTVLGHPGAAIAELMSAPAIALGSDMLANVMDKPEVVDWLSKVTDGDVKKFESLPPELKAVFTGNLREMVNVAKSKNLAVSPSLTKFLAAGAATQSTRDDAQKSRQSPAELRKEAEELNKKNTQSGANLAYHYEYDEKQGKIVKVGDGAR